MAVSNLIERLGRVIFEAPFTGRKISRDAPELAEVRLAILDAVKEKAYRAGGKFVFPYNLIRINLVGVPVEQSNAFRSEFFSGYFADELRSGLTRSSYRYPEDLTVEIHTVSDMPAPGESWLSIETLMKEPKSSVVSIPQAASLIVAKGKAEPSQLNLNATRINIGRTRHVTQSNGPSRTNDIAFSDGDAIGLGVSRQHAHVEFDAAIGEYRVFNDRVYKGADNCNLYLIRAGNSQPVHRGGHGAALQQGDEIHLGQAVIRFELT